MLAPTPQSKSAQSGVTLLEMMIAVLVISFGLLGLAGLQGFALKYNHTAYIRSIATQYAYEMADRIRANATQDYSTATPSDRGGCLTACTPIQIAEDDLNTIQTAVAAALPGGALATPVRDATSGIYTLTITWTEPDGAKTFETTFQP